MLQITIPAVDPIEQWDEEKQEFSYTNHMKEHVLQLEHSLVSLSKWESKWCKPFLTKEAKNTEETIDYIRCMTITQNISEEIYNNLTDENIDQVNKYIEAPMTATWFGKENDGKSSGKKITSELIYYWMVSLNIPFECQKWHLNRLLTLIKVCNNENKPPQKRSRKEILSRNSAINAARRKKWNTRG